MSEKLQLYICDHFIAETHSVLSSGNFSDVSASFFPSFCNYPINIRKRFLESTISKKSSDEKVFCICSCIPQSDKDNLNKENYKQLYLSSCFQMFAPKDYINKLISDGAYIITPGWLVKWEQLVKQWGEKEHIRQLFSESVRKLVLLDTGISPECSANLKDLSIYLDCPSETKTIGLDYYHYYLENQILKWRLEKKNKDSDDKNSKPNNIESDYAMALDLMSNLIYLKNEDEIADKIMYIFQMMFAAKKISYLSIIDSKPIKFWSLPLNQDDIHGKQRLSSYDYRMELTESEKGFYFAIGKENKTLAVIEIDDIAYPENITKYQNLAIAMNSVLALSIENTRYLQEIHNMNDSLREINTTKDKLFSIIAHDLRSPFNAILGFSDMILHESQESGDKEFIRLINSSAKNTLILLENLLSWAKSQSGKLILNSERIVLSNLISQSIDLLNYSAKSKNITLNYFQSEEIVVFSDINMIKTILRNLVSNAIKFTNKNGIINIYTMEINSFIEVVVSDNGIGMSDENQKNLFSIETNKTTIGTSNETGSGLGLVLCKELVEKLGGAISVDSKEGEGSKFKFTIPYKKSK